VHENEVDAVETEALEAGLQRSADTVGGEVEHGMHGRDVDEDRVGCLYRIGHEYASDLGRHRDLVAWQRGESSAESPFRQPVPVQRRGVEVANAGGEGGAHDGDG